MSAKLKKFIYDFERIPILLRIFAQEVGIL